MKKTTTKTKTSRYEDLKQILEDRRREILNEVQDKIRDVRAEGTQNKSNEVFDAAESSDADIQEDIEFALIQMKAETLNKINEALTRLEEGVFGNCFECGEEIAEAAPAGAALRRPLQGLRGSARNGGRAREDLAAAPRRGLAFHGHVPLD